jgi:polyisoprenoid-binding protein YceI
MKTPTPTRLFSLFALFLCVTTAKAQTGSQTVDFKLDPATTAIRWTLHSTLHTVHGTFQLKSGAFGLDPETGKVQGVIVIDATSGDSQDSARDSHMHKDVIESAKFSEITFRPAHLDGKFDPTQTRTYKVDGTFTIHGQDHPLQLTVDVHPQGSGVALTTKFSIPFVKWGMKDPSTFVLRVDKEVQLEIESVATLK